MEEKYQNYKNKAELRLPTLGAISPSAKIEITNLSKINV